MIFFLDAAGERVDFLVFYNSHEIAVNGIPEQGTVYVRFISDTNLQALTSEDIPLSIDLADFPNRNAEVISLASDEAGAVITVETFHFSDELDLAVTHANWNPREGGLDFTYSVQGDLTTASTAEVFWARGKRYSDRISDEPIFTQSIEAGDRGKDPVSQTVHVSGSDLNAAPEGTTHLIVVVDKDNIIDDEETNENNVFALPDVEITYGGNPPARQILSDYTIGIIKDAQRYAGEASILINSTHRTPLEQADEMLRIIHGPGGIEKARALYTREFGKQVLKVYEDELEKYNRELDKYFDKREKQPNRTPPPVPDFRSLMADKIAEILKAHPDTAFAHTRNFSRWNTVDIQVASVESKKLFLDALRSDPRISKVLFPPDDDAYHIEVRLR
jgi:hypothetical protein